MIIAPMNMCTWPSGASPAGRSALKFATAVGAGDRTDHREAADDGTADTVDHAAAVAAMRIGRA